MGYFTIFPPLCNAAYFLIEIILGGESVNVIPIQLPSLKQRREDIPLLVTHFIEKYNKVFKKEIKSISQHVINMMSYSWPGNVRELENLVERAVIMAKDDVISEIELPVSDQKQARERFEDIDDQITNSSLDDFLAHYEIIYITRLLKRCKGRIDASAKISGIDVKTLYRKMKKYNIKKIFLKISAAIPKNPLHARIFITYLIL